MKKYMIFVVVSFTLFFITACGEKRGSSKIVEANSIMVLAPNFDKAISGPLRVEALNFKKSTNITVNIITPSWHDMPDKMKEALNDEKINYDVFVAFSSWAGSILYDNAQEIPLWVKEKLDWNDILPIYKNNILSWRDKYLFLPYDGDCVNLYYRKDIFSNKEYKKRFKNIFGYDLSVPKTWDQYKDIAKFFNGWDWDNDGRIEYGFAGSRIKGYGTTLLFLTKAAAYAKYPFDRSYYFDPDTMKPRINNPGFIKALEEYIDIMKYAPGQIINFAPAEVRESFIMGDTALAIDWANTGAMAQNSKESVVQGKVGYAKLPGSNIVYNPNKNQWEKIYNAPSSITGNWVIVVNKNSKNKKAAFDFASYMCSKKITNKYVVEGSSGINPSRYSHLKLNGNIAKWKENGFSKDQAERYLNTIFESLASKNVVSDLRIPGADLYYGVLENYIDKAVKKEMTPKEALDMAAKEWDKITKKMGKEKQLKLYRESINE